VIDTALLSAIRRWHFRVDPSIWEIATHIGLFKNTLKKYIIQEPIKPNYPLWQSVSKLDAFETVLREAKKPRKLRKTVKQLYHELLRLG